MWQYLETCSVNTSGVESCSWHLVGRGQECCSMSYSAQGSPLHKESSGLKCQCAPGIRDRLKRRGVTNTRSSSQPVVGGSCWVTASLPVMCENSDACSVWSPRLSQWNQTPEWPMVVACSVTHSFSGCLPFSDSFPCSVTD